MALRKEEFYYESEEHKHMEKSQSSKRERVTLDLSAELSERVQAVARQHNLSASQYLESLLEEIVPKHSNAEQVRRPVTLEDVERLMRVREQLLRDRGGKPFESSVELLRQEREEREKELGL